MSEKLKIKLSIADRVYPLSIRPDQEEELRKATKRIEETIKIFEKNYAVRDKQDVLAMCALQFASQAGQLLIQRNSESDTIYQRLSSLDKVLEDYLS